MKNVKESLKDLRRSYLKSSLANSKTDINANQFNEQEDREDEDKEEEKIERKRYTTVRTKKSRRKKRAKKKSEKNGRGFQGEEHTLSQVGCWRFNER